MPQAISEALGGVEHVSSIVRGLKAFGHPDRSDEDSVDLNDALRNTVTVARGELRHVADVVTDLGDIPRSRASEAT